MTLQPPPPGSDPAASGETAAAGEPVGGDQGHDPAAPTAHDDLEPPASAPDEDERGADAAPAATADGGPRRRRRRGRRGGAGRRAAAALAPAGAEDGDDLDAEHAPDDAPETADGEAREASTDGEGAVRRKKRRRRSRRGKRSTEAERDGEAREADAHGAADGSEPDTEDGEERADGNGGADDSQGGAEARSPDDAGRDGRRKKRSRRSRRKRGRDGASERTAADAPAEPRADGQSGRKRSRRGGRGRKGGEDEPIARDEAAPVGIDAIPGEDDDLAELEPVRPKRRAPESDEPHTPEVVRDQRILVNAADPEETRVVVVEGQKIVDLQMTVRDHESYVNDIYRGRVVNLETAIGAAFVDFGQGRNGFLHVSDVMDVYGEVDWSLDKLLTARTAPEEWGEGGKGDDLDEEKEKEKGGKRRSQKARARPRKRRTISELLQKGQTVAVQITKDAIGDKGPALTTYISIPGRYLVLMPSLQRTGVSRKIEDDKERRRLKRILEGLEIPDGMGVIVRTAGVGRTKADIQRDLDYLVAVWADFSKKLVLGRNPAPLYQESDVAIRTMRDLFSARTETVVVDSPSVFEHMREFTQKLMPEHLDRIVLHEAPKPLFHHYGIEADYERIFARRVELPSGGSIVIDQTEALVAIDVNSGRTRDEGADFEDIALKTNLEAAPEIARQIRLRDLGGIVVLDFIDMLRQSSRKLVERTLRDCLATDRARSKVGRISQFGLLELTRQRLGPGLSRLVYDTCPACKGSGRRRTAQSRAQAVLRRLGSALTQKGFTKVEVVAHHDTVEWLEKRNRAELDAIAERAKREVVLKGVDEQAEESIFHYLRADGREVRPGGRRKR